MALHWRPVGPEPAQTYWLRRAVLAAAVLLVVLLLLQLFGGGGDDRLAQEQADVSATTTPGPVPTPDAGASVNPSATPDPSAGTTATPGASAAPCADDALTIEAAASDESYDVGEQPRLELRITNTGTVPCSRDLGQAQVELQVVSGNDRIWSSDDCAPGGQAALTVLQPGGEETSTVTWPGTRSLPGCQGDDEPAEAGTYRVTGRVGELRHEGETFVLE